MREIANLNIIPTVSYIIIVLVKAEIIISTFILQRECKVRDISLLFNMFTPIVVVPVNSSATKTAYFFVK